jgi:hypothetical protein
MKPLKEAQSAGQIIMDKARANAEKMREELLKKKAQKTTKEQ